MSRRHQTHPEVESLDERICLAADPFAGSGLPHLAVHAGGNTSVQVGQPFTRSGTYQVIQPGDHLVGLALYEGRLEPVALRPDGTFTLAHTWTRPASWTVAMFVVDETFFALGEATFTVKVTGPHPHR
jgi:hypothetical protein